MSKNQEIDKKLDKNIVLSAKFIKTVERNSSNSKIIKSAKKTIQNSRVKYAF